MAAKILICDDEPVVHESLRLYFEAEGYDVVLPLGLTNDGIGYFPMQEAYDEGGYEARSSNFKAGIAELIIDEGKKVLAELRK